MNIFALLPAWVWIVISGIFFAAGEFLSKEFALNPGWGIFGFIVLVDVISITTWLPAIFQKNQLSITGVIWSLASLMLTVGVGVLLFNEKLTLIRVLGIFFGIIALILLSW
jgi:multidrug transporter EmrE-like cation transporter